MTTFEATTASRPGLLRVRLAVRGVLILGLIVSVVANVLHANGNPISQTIAAWPPLALLLTVELISRVPVHRRSLAAVRLGATTTIASIAAWVSYWHMAGVAARYGEVGASPFLLPLTVDGLVIVASVSLVELAGRIRSGEQATTPTAAVKADATTAPTGLSTTVVAPVIDRPTAPVVAATRPALNAADHTAGRHAAAPVDQTPVAPADQRVSEATTPTDRPAIEVPTTPVDAEATTEPTGRSLHVVGPSAAVANAALLRGRYGADLPTSLRTIRTDMGWSHDRTTKAVDAYNAGADQATTDQTEDAEERAS